MSGDGGSLRAPWWFVALIVVFGLIGLGLSGEVSRVMAAGGWAGADYTGWLYPAYIVIASMCSWASYYSRNVLAWILLGLVILSDVGLFMTFVL